MPRILPPAIERITARSIPNGVTGCLIWQGGLSSQGRYPFIKSDDGRVRQTYVLVYEHNFGKIPDEPAPDGTRWEIHHRCHNRRCNELSHLQLMSRSQHMRLHSELRAAERAAKAA
jgi:hypothetical protein